MKNVKTKQRFSLSAVALAAALMVSGFASCSKSEMELPPDGSRAISLSANVQATTQTKAAVVDRTFPANTTNVFRLTAFSGTAVPTTNWSATPYFNNIQVNSGAASALTLATAQYYPANGDKVYFYGYAPEATSLTAGTVATAPIANYTITGQEDIMAAQVVTGIAATTTGTQSQPDLTFTHKLMQVRFKIVKDVSFEASKKVTEILVKNVRTSAKLNIGTGALTFEGTANQTLSLPITAGTKDEITAGGTEMDGCIMLEPAGTGSSITLKVTADGVTYDNISVPLTGSNAGMAGTSHLVTLTFKRLGIAITASIAPWTDGGQTEAQPQFVPALFYGDAANNGSNTTALQGSTTSSYNSFTVGSNGPGYASTADAYVGEKGYYKLEVAAANELNPADSKETMSWEIAMNLCKAKTTDGGGWRLPRLSELRLMYLNKSSLETTPGFTAFQSISFSDFWSSTEYSDHPSTAWYINFSSTTGTTGAYDKGDPNYVRCVRELPTPPAKMYYGSTNGGVTTALQGSTTSSYNSFTVGSNGPGYASTADAYVGEKGYYKLEVAAANELNPADSKETMSWEIAMNLCKTKTTDGGGWRLPRLSELKLMYLNKSSLETMPGFTAFPGNAFWSSTEYSADTSLAWYIHFLSGHTNSYAKSSNYFVRCVREL